MNWHLSVEETLVVYLNYSQGYKMRKQIQTQHATNFGLKLYQYCALLDTGSERYRVAKTVHAIQIGVCLSNQAQ